MLLSIETELSKNKIKSDNQEFTVRLCLLVMSEATSLKSYQNDCLNMRSQNRHARIDLQKKVGQSPAGLKSTVRTIGK